MSTKMMRRWTTVILILSLVVTAFSGCSKKEKDDALQPAAETESAVEVEQGATEATEEEVSQEVKTLRWGTHWVAGLDPNYTDPTTGDYTMDETTRQASLAALQAAKEQLNVEVEFVQYATDTRSELITSVLANNPVCDIAVLWGGSESTVLSQNILQPLDDYADLFADEEYAWMFYDKLYGHNYFLTSKQAFIPRWPLIYNASMIEKVDALKDADGNTIYPTDLFVDGNWTWGTFKDYISKIQAFYSNTAAPEEATKDMIQAYVTDHRYAGLSAMFAAGGSIYGESGILADSAQSIKGTAYIKELMDAGLMSDPGVYDNGYTPVWCQGASDFQAGGSVFTDCPDWWIAGVSSAAAERGESIGIVPWPRPDDMAADDPNYKQVLTVGDSIGILKGVDADTTKLALEFLKVFYSTYYKTLGGVDSVIAYKDSASTDQATSFGFDIFNETYGDDLLKTFQYVANQTVPNDYSDLLGFRVIWDDVFGKSLYGVDGFASYDVSIAANIDLFNKKVTDMEAVLSSDEIRDNIAPNFSSTQAMVFPVGTDPSSIIFGDYVTVEDAIDGILDMTTATIEYTNVDFNTVGTYNDGVKVTMADFSGNEGNKKFKVAIYNPENKSEPVITLAEAPRTIAIDENAAEVKWMGDFISSAVDADGIDVSANLTADITGLDTTTPGEYDVPLTVTDFAGNVGTLTITVTVAKAE